MSIYKIIAQKSCGVCSIIMDIWNNHPNKKFCSANCIGKAKRREKRGLPNNHKFSIDLSMEDKFKNKINKNGPLPDINIYGNIGKCWTWTDRLARGYGQIWNKTEYIMAHVYSYILFFNEIPSDKIIRHKCDNKNCVNPEHLILGTYFDNSQDMIKRNRSLVGEKHPMSKLTNEQAQEIRSMKKQKTLSEIAKIYSIGISQVYRIQNNQSWKG